MGISYSKHSNDSIVKYKQASNSKVETLTSIIKFLIKTFVIV